MPLLAEPIPFSEALDRLAQKRVLPTGLSSAELRREWPEALRRRSLFSARTTKAAILQEYQDKLAELLDGKTNIATARMELQQLIDALGYTPEHGFAGDEERDIPPAERGSLRDLGSRTRVDLVLTTNMRQMANYGFWKQGQSDFALFAYPCYELVRIYPRNIPRGLRLAKGALEHVAGEDWPSRWETVGGKFYGLGRMIARKDDEIWGRLGDSSIFRDALDTWLPPFAFNSGYGWREIDRAEAIKLGVIDEDTEVEGQRHDLNENVQASVDGFDPEFLRAVKRELELDIIEGRAGLVRNRDLPAPALKPLPQFTEFILPDGTRVAANSREDRIYARDHLGRFALDGGPLSYKDNFQRGSAAVDRALSRKINVPNAMNVEGIGRIDFPWGTSGEKKRDYSGGFGLAHVLAKHGEADARAIPRMILEATSKLTVPELFPDTIEAKSGHARRALLKKKKSAQRQNRIELEGEDAKGGYIVKLIQKKNSRSAWLLTGFTRKAQK